MGLPPEEYGSTAEEYGSTPGEFLVNQSFTPKEFHIFHSSPIYLGRGRGRGLAFGTKLRARKPAD